MRVHQPGQQGQVAEVVVGGRVQLRAVYPPMTEAMPATASLPTMLISTVAPSLMTLPGSKGQEPMSIAGTLRGDLAVVTAAQGRRSVYLRPRGATSFSNRLSIPVSARMP